MGSKKIITLINAKGNKHNFVFAHALALLRLQNRKEIPSWVISEQNWEFKNNEITRKPNNRKTKKASK